MALSSHSQHDTPACLPFFVSNLRHDRLMAGRKSDGMDPWPRMSAWLPPGLVLAWLAVLATFVHNVANLLIAWGATVSVAVLLTIVLALLYRVVSSRSRSKVSGGTPEQQGPLPSAADSPRLQPGLHTALRSSDVGERPGSDMAESGGIAENAPTVGSGGPDSFPGPSSAAEVVSRDTAPTPVRGRPAPGTAESAGPLETTAIAVIPGLRVLTATEVAAVLRIDRDIIITAISNGELPGNRLAGHWRVDQGALIRWLQGAYRHVSHPGPPSPAEPGIDQVQ
jgi:excisionase family DNA binding protein